MPDTYRIESCIERLIERSNPPKPEAACCHMIYSSRWRSQSKGRSCSGRHHVAAYRCLAALGESRRPRRSRSLEMPNPRPGHGSRLTFPPAQSAEDCVAPHFGLCREILCVGHPIQLPHGRVACEVDMAGLPLAPRVHEVGRDMPAVGTRFLAPAGCAVWALSDPYSEVPGARCYLAADFLRRPLFRHWDTIRTDPP